MLHFHQFLISRIIPEDVYRQLCYLWQKIAEQQPENIVAVSEKDLVNNQTKSVKGFQFKNFHLVIASNLQALLFVEKQINESYYQVGITFDEQEINDFCELLENYISPQLKKRIKLILSQSKIDNLSRHNFVFNLLRIITEPLAINENYLANYYNSQNIEVILKNRIEQERILHQVGQQIGENLDLLVIVKMTIEQVQHLLQIDRLVIYQLNVPVKSESEAKTNFIDTVTYEAKASAIIPSILGLDEETCFSNNSYFEQKYLNGFNLVINDIDNCHLDNCLKDLMKKLAVKAKVVFPIIVKDKLWGLLIAHQCFSARKWKTSEIKFLKHISEYLAIAIYQSNSYNQLQKQKKLLEQQVEKKARQLQDALIAAEIAHQSKTEFLGNISHELRTPLTCVIGLSGTLLHWSKEDNQNSSLDQEKQTRYLKIIQDSGRKLLQLINNILDFADIEAGKSLLKIELISLQNLSKMVLLYGLEIARNKGIKVKLDYKISPDLALFNADPERLYQILINLIDNAIKFTPSGGEVILRVSRNNNQVIFEIEDTGIGIHKDQIPLLFNKFKQLENYRTRNYAGTGLGLALTKHLVELHGGTIEVLSIVNQGSIFTIYIPDSPTNYVDIESQNSTETDKTNLNKTIVIICDDDEIATLLCELLTAAEYQVIWLVDVTEAINRIRLIKPKIVIIEQNQQVSLKLSQEIKSLLGNDVHLIVVKEEISGNEWEKLSNSGINEYLLKPLQPRILLEKVNTIICL